MIYGVLDEVGREIIAGMFNNVVDQYFLQRNPHAQNEEMQRALMEAGNQGMFHGAHNFHVNQEDVVALLNQVPILADQAEAMGSSAPDYQPFQRVTTFKDLLLCRVLNNAVQPDGSRDIPGYVRSLLIPETLKRHIEKIDIVFKRFARHYIDLLDLNKFIGAIALKDGKLDEEQTIRNLFLYNLVSKSVYQILCLARGMEQDLRAFAESPAAYQLLEDRSLFPGENAEAACGFHVTITGIHSLLIGEHIGDNNTEQDLFIIPMKSGILSCQAHKWLHGIKLMLRMVKEREHLFKEEVFVECFVYLFNRLSHAGEEKNVRAFMEIARHVVAKSLFVETICEENTAGHLPIERFALWYELAPEYKEIRNMLVAVHRFLPRHDLEMLKFRIERDLEDRERAAVAVQKMVEVEELARQ